jgi:HEPN domain-containing protein
VYAEKVNRAEFKNLARVRLEDAKVLLRRGRASAAYYIAGYAVECALKACIAKRTRRSEFPPKNSSSRFYTHELGKLLKEIDTQLANTLNSEVMRGSSLGKNWKTVSGWDEESRYDADAGKDARDLIKAIEDPQDGVLECIKRYW